MNHSMSILFAALSSICAIPGLLLGPPWLRRSLVCMLAINAGTALHAVAKLAGWLQ